MKGQRFLCTGVALVLTSPAHADEVGRWRPLIDQASIRCGVPAAWIERVMRAESAGLTAIDGRPIVSRAGAMGLMQLMPGTWEAMRRWLGLGANPHDPADNITAGACYLRLMYERFGSPGLFAAYNAGPGRYSDWLATGRALPAETRTYLAAVGGGAPNAPVRMAASPRRSLFFAIGAAAKADRAAGQIGLFVPLSSASSRD